MELSAPPHTMPHELGRLCRRQRICGRSFCMYFNGGNDDVFIINNQIGFYISGSLHMSGKKLVV